EDGLRALVRNDAGRRWLQRENIRCQPTRVTLWPLCECGLWDGSPSRNARKKMATTREHPVPARESDVMASVRVRPLGWVSFKKREVFDDLAEIFFRPSVEALKGSAPTTSSHED
ncbi:unnamed protein product, partial [Ascophyllum nodosum]